MRLFDNAAIKIELFPRRKRQPHNVRQNQLAQTEKSQVMTTKAFATRNESLVDIERRPKTPSPPFSPKRDHHYVYDQQIEAPVSPLSPTSPVSPSAEESEVLALPEKTAPNTFLALKKAREEAARKGYRSLYSPTTGQRMAPSVERLAPNCAAAIGNLYLPQKSPNTHNKISENMAAALLGKKSREDLQKKSSSDPSLAKKSREDLRKTSSKSQLSSTKSREALSRKNSMRQLTASTSNERPPLPNASPPKSSMATQTSPCDTFKPLPTMPAQIQRSMEVIHGRDSAVASVPVTMSHTTANSTIAKRRSDNGAVPEKARESDNHATQSLGSGNISVHLTRPSTAPSKSSRQANGYEHSTADSQIQTSGRYQDEAKATAMDWMSNGRQQTSTKLTTNMGKDDYRRGFNGADTSKIGQAVG